MGTRNSKRNSATHKKQDLTLDELEKIIRDAESQSPEQILEFEFNYNEDESPKAFEALADIQDPELSYKLYYKVICALKRKYLKGNDYKKIRDEINLYLKEGNIKGRDSRMAYTRLYGNVARELISWVEEFKASNRFQLFLRFNELNKQYKKDFPS